MFYKINTRFCDVFIFYDNLLPISKFKRRTPPLSGLFFFNLYWPKIVLLSTCLRAIVCADIFFMRNSQCKTLNLLIYSKPTDEQWNDFFYNYYNKTENYSFECLPPAAAVVIHSYRLGNASRRRPNSIVTVTPFSQKLWLLFTPFSFCPQSLFHYSPNLIFDHRTNNEKFRFYLKTFRINQRVPRRGGFYYSPKKMFSCVFFFSIINKVLLHIYTKLMSTND